MTGVFFRQAFPLEDVAEVAFTIVTEDFYAPTISIPHFLDATGHLIVKTRPAATAAEFIVAVVQRVIAAAADKDTVDLKIIVLTGEGHFGSFPDDNAFFFRSEGVVIFGRFHVGHNTGMALRVPCLRSSAAVSQ